MSRNTIFRKSSLDRVSSPEELGDYIKVTRPGIWLILSAVIVLLIGVCFWSVFATLTTSQEAVAVVQDGKATCYVYLNEVNNLTPGMEVKIGDSVGSIRTVATTPMEITGDFDGYALYLSGLQEGDWVVPVTVDIKAQDGIYKAFIVLETISPISFLLN